MNSVVIRLLRTAVPVRVSLAASTVLRLSSQLSAAALILLPAWVFTTGPELSLFSLGLTMAVLALGAAASRWGEQVCGHRAAFSLLALMRVQLYSALVRQGTPRITAGSGAVMSVATRDINSIEVFFAHTIGPVVTAAVLSLGAVATLFALDPTAAVIGVFGILIGWLIPVAGRRTAGPGEAALRSSLAQHLSEDAAGRLEIRSHQAADHRLSQLAILEGRLSQTVTTQGLRVGVRQGLALVWPWTTAALILLATSNVVAAVVIIALAPAVDAVEGFARTLPTALDSARRFYELIDAPVTIPESPTPVALPPGPLSVAWEKVTIGHRAPLFTDLNMHIGAGEHVGLVGPSGKGKSTLAATVVRLLDAQAGRVLIGGIDIREVSLQELRTAVCFVEQSSTLFRGSVLDNLRVGNPELSEEAAAAAMQAASISEVAVETDTATLSGGQKQRVCLARALARQPRVLILDEATSHQDALNQAELSATLAGLKDTTVIIIAHRQAALTGVDRIIDLG